MLGFLKKFKKSKKDKDSDSKKKKDDSKKAPDGNTPDEEKSDGKASKGKKKRKLPVKLIIIVLIFLIVAGGAGFAVYKFYFSAKSSEPQAPVYKSTKLNHLQLPDEILHFSFDHFPDLYSAMVTYNMEMDLLDAEIARIETIGSEYPDQKKIADKEKKNWEKTKAGLEKVFLKVQKPVKETYVLFRVNKEQGLEQIKAKTKELAETANAALAPVQELTQKLKTTESIPEGMIQGTLYKLKKKFL